TLGAVDHECVDFGLVHPHQRSTTTSTGVLHCGFRCLQHWRGLGDRSSGQWCWDDLEGLLEHSPFLEALKHRPKLNLITLISATFYLYQMLYNRIFCKVGSPTYAGN